MEGPQTWRSHERRYRLTADTFTKSELRQTELQVSIRNTIIQPRWSRERLQNEARTLQLIASETQIPVPGFISLAEDEHGLLRLVTKPARGVALDAIARSQADAAVQKVEECLTSSILPQLASLRSWIIGGVDPRLPLVPPSWIYSRDKRADWRRAPENTSEFSLHHCDLGQHNIFVDPQTFEITDIIDWEFAGYYPDEFELPLWRHPHDQYVDRNEHIDKLISFLDHPSRCALSSLCQLNNQMDTGGDVSS